MEGMMNKHMRRILLFAAVFALLLPSTVLAAPKIPLDEFATWDSDMINVEQVTETGKEVYVAVLDTGLAPNWRDYFDKDQVNVKLGTGFYQPISFKAHQDECGLGIEIGKLSQTTWVGSKGTTHGTHVASTIIGYNYRSTYDALGGYPLPPIKVKGIASDVTIIPVKVLADYQIPALPNCVDEDGNPDPQPAQLVTFGTDAMVAAGIEYVTDLAVAGYKPMVINMSLGGPSLSDGEKAAIDRAIANGVIVVASAGNEGSDGMGYPGAYEPTISVGSVGWVHEWWQPGPTAPDYSVIPPPIPYFRLWWLQSGYYPYNDISEPTPVGEVYVSGFSSRELPGQELDVLAPGSWVRGPYPGYPGYSHLPWWSKGIGDLVGGNPGNFYYVGGTSMASPHVAAAAAMMLEKNPYLTQIEVEAILKNSALPIPASTAVVPVFHPAGLWYGELWGNDATGAGLVQVDAALGAVAVP
jgi:subtilisin family serine protease